MFKYVLDIIVSIMLLLICSPIIILVGIISKVALGSPVFYVNTRIGRYGKEFKMLKFRTMDTNPYLPKSCFNPGDRSRVTKFGKFLRRTKIDELPQLLNVLSGDMSIVGPRPEVKKWTEVYPEKWAIVHTVKPGMTDNASIEFRNEEELLAQAQNPEETYRIAILPRKLDLYIDYVNNHTFFGDILILLRTINAILFK